MNRRTGSDKPISFSPHAKEKLKRLAQIGITEERATRAITKPDSIISGYFARKIAQSTLTEDLLLRVVYEETDNNILVVTLYPAKRQRYEQSNL